MVLPRHASDRTHAQLSISCTKLSFRLFLVLRSDVTAVSGSRMFFEIYLVFRKTE